MDVETVIQVLPEAPGCHLRVEITIGGRHHSGLHRNGAIGPQPGDQSFLQYPEELGLGRKRQLADLVEEESPPFSCLEGPFAGRSGSGEGTPLVPEQLALYQVLG
jgi:hypothetical protein